MILYIIGGMPLFVAGFVAKRHSQNSWVLVALIIAIIGQTLICAKITHSNPPPPINHKIGEA